MKLFQLPFFLFFAVHANAQKAPTPIFGEWFGNDLTYFKIDSNFIEYNFGDIYTSRSYNFEIEKDSLKISNWSSYPDEFFAEPLVFLIEKHLPDSMILTPISKTAEIVSNPNQVVDVNSLQHKPITFYPRTHFFDEKIEFEGIEFAETQWTGTPKYKILKIDAAGNLEIVRYKMNRGKIGKKDRIFQSKLAEEEFNLLKKIYQTSDLKSLSDERSWQTQCDGTDYHFKYKIAGIEKEFISEHLPEILEPLKDFLVKKYHSVNLYEEGVLAD